MNSILLGEPLIFLHFGLSLFHNLFGFGNFLFVIGAFAAIFLDVGFVSLYVFLTFFDFLVVAFDVVLFAGYLVLTFLDVFFKTFLVGNSRVVRSCLKII